MVVSRSCSSRPRSNHFGNVSKIARRMGSVSSPASSASSNAVCINGLLSKDSRPPSSARKSTISSIGVSCRSRRSFAFARTSCDAYRRGSGLRNRAPTRPPNSTLLSSSGSITRPRISSGMSTMDCWGAVAIAISDTAHVVHELVVRLFGAGAGDLVVAALELGEARDVALEPRRLPAAPAILVPVHRDPVARDEPAPVALGKQVEEGEPACLHALSRQQIAVRIEQEWNRVGEPVVKPCVADGCVADRLHHRVDARQPLDAEEIPQHVLPVVRDVLEPLHPSAREQHRAGREFALQAILTALQRELDEVRGDTGDPHALSAKLLGELREPPLEILFPVPAELDQLRPLLQYLRIDVQRVELAALLCRPQPRGERQEVGRARMLV